MTYIECIAIAIILYLSTPVVPNQVIRVGFATTSISVSEESLEALVTIELMANSIVLTEDLVVRFITDSSSPGATAVGMSV